ncbi:unnamed protein product [Caenorhabditis nigoni]
MTRIMQKLWKKYELTLPVAVDLTEAKIGKESGKLDRALITILDPDTKSSQLPGLSNRHLLHGDERIWDQMDSHKSDF